MPGIDLHNHTKYSHGANTPAEMYAKAQELGLTLLGFSEHSPRPEGFTYTHEYREELKRHLPDYVREVTAIRDAAKQDPTACQVLFGMEMDWLKGELEFMTKASKAFDFDYLIGSVHFIDHWGFDDGRTPWEKASQEQCEGWYQEYFLAWREMLKSKLYNIAAHPDLIKIFSVNQFHIWLQKSASQELVRSCLEELKASGMAMEISSAGLRKVCGEIYPSKEIMSMARELDLKISFASDAHTTKDVGYGLERLADYAKSFGFTTQVYFDHGRMTEVAI